MGRGRQAPAGPAPKGKVKAFNWTKMPPMKVEGTFFAKLPTVNGEKLDIDIKWDLFEEAFAVAPPKKAEEGPAKGPAKPTIQTFLDPKTAQNLNIWFSKYKKIGVEGVVKAAKNIDSEVFSEASSVAALRSFIPSADDVRFLVNHFRF